MVQVNWTFLARNDLKGIFEYIAKDSKKYAKLEILKIKSRTQILKFRPLIGKEVIERGNISVRELVEGNYRIIYKIVDKRRIDILTIHHSARDLENREIDE
jgi:toxin ParE1/3/4